MSQVVVPDIGDFKEVEVIEVLVKPGDAVTKEQSLITLESDKATMEIPSPAAGVVKELKIKTGDKVSKGSPILVLDEKKQDEKKQDEKKQEEKKPEVNRPQPPIDARPQKLSAASGQTQTVSVPDIGDFKEVEVIEVLVKPGDAVAKEQSLITLESDKATMEIPSPGAGVVKELKVKVGDKVAKDSPILVLQGNDERRSEARAPEPAGPAAPRPAAPRAAAAPAPITNPSARPVPREPREEAAVKAHASPSVRKFARELGVPLAQVPGSGPKGRVLHADIQGFVKGVLAKAPPPAAKGGGSLPFDLPAWPEVDFAKFGPVESVPLSRIQKLSGPYLHRNWVSIPHVTQFDEADITDLEAFRKGQTAETEKKGFKLTMLAFLIKACVTALREYPQFNASLERSGESVIIKKYYHIGVAVDTPEGLVVPVVRDADRKGVFDLAKELGEISKLAREKRLKAGDMQGGTFSISSLGGIGGTAFTPIINAPEVAILGVSRAYLKPVYSGKGEKGEDLFKARLVLPLSLSYDHRVIDGATAARFTTYLVSVLSDIRKSLL